MALNTYASLDELKAVADSPPPQSDDVLLDWLEDLSRAADRFCDRQFFVSIATRRFDPGARGKTWIDDLLSVFEVKVDTDLDQTPDEVIPATNYFLTPYNRFPKTAVVIGSTEPVTLFVDVRRSVQIDAVWGYGDGERDEPWDEVTGETVTVADATTTTLTVPDSTNFEVGATYRVAGTGSNRDEYFFVDAKPSATTLTVQRGVNGSTAAAHSTASVFRIKHHPTLKGTVIKSAVRRVETEGTVTSESERIGSYSYSTGATGGDADGDIEGAFTAEEASRLKRLRRMRGVGV